MERFLERQSSRVLGVLSGFDRVVFRGTLRSLDFVDGLGRFLGSQGVLYKDFGAFAERCSTRLKEQAERIAQQQGRPLHYVESAQESKEKIARGIMERDGIREGLICVLTCVEPCMSFSMRRDAERKVLRLVREPRKCLHVYYYFVDREFGLMHVRIQSWLPFPIQVCLNGREYLARQLDKAKIGYEQRDNCFVRIDDVAAAQAILDRLAKRKWTKLLKALARRVNPLLGENGLGNGTSLRDYYWMWRQGEYATDVMFRSDVALKEAYPSLVRHALTLFGCRDLLRFLGRRVNRRFSGEVTTTCTERIEGICVKHWIEENSIKMYDKQGSVLRIETTINNPRRFKAYRWGTRQGKRRKAWLPLRKAIVDLPRLVEICQAANRRYLEALADVEVARPVKTVLDPVSRRIEKEGRPYRGLRPVSPEEAAVFELLLNGKYRLQGFRNADIRAVLCPTPDNAGSSMPSVRACRAACGKASRYLRLLRAHGLIKKIPRTQTYRLTQRGTALMAASVKLRETTIANLAC